MKNDDFKRIIDECCKSDKKTFDEIADEIMMNFMMCDLSNCNLTKRQLEKLKESNGRKLPMTRYQFNEYFHNNFRLILDINGIINIKFRNYTNFDIKYLTDDCDKNTIEDFTKKCCKIFCEKQKLLMNRENHKAK